MICLAERPAPDHDFDPYDWSLGHWFYALVFALSVKRRMHGITVGSSPVGAHDVERSFEKVDQALQAIAEYDRPRYFHILRHVPRIWVGPVPHYARGQWVDQLRLCMLRDDFVGHDAVSVAYLAAIIVHEATHARLARTGIAFDEDVRPRVERLCIKSQIEFARKHPDGGPLIQVFEQNLERRDEWWSDQRLRSVQLRALKNLGLPRGLRWAIGNVTKELS
jgi:hypothetical protein